MALPLLILGGIALFSAIVGGANGVCRALGIYHPCFERRNGSQAKRG